MLQTHAPNPVPQTEAHLTWEEAKNGEGHSFAQAVAYIWEHHHDGRMHHTFTEDIQITTE